MKLAEAILDRTELQKTITDLQSRIRDNAIVQEGDSPAEDPAKLFIQLCESYTNLENLTRRINATNNNTSFDGNLKLCDALALRDCLDKQVEVHAYIVSSFNLKSNRSTKTEIKYVTTMEPNIVRSHLEKLKANRKELDRKIQHVNWSTTLVDL
jgi:hypothetical protein